MRTFSESLPLRRTIDYGLSNCREAPVRPQGHRWTLGTGLEPPPDVVESHAVKSHFLVRLSGLKRLAPWVAFHHGYTGQQGPELRASLGIC